MSNRMARLGKQELYFGKISSMDEIIAELEAVTLDDVQTFAAEFLRPEKFSRVMLVPSA